MQIIVLKNLSHCHTPTPLMSVSDYSPKRYSPTTLSYKLKKLKTRKLSKWAQFVESIEIVSREHDSSESIDEKIERDKNGNTQITEKKDFFDFFKRKDIERNTATTSSMRTFTESKAVKLNSKSLTSSPLKIEKKMPILKCFDIPKTTTEKKIKDRVTTPTNIIEENLIKLMTSLPIRRSSTPSTQKLTQKRISELRSSGVKTDSEDDYLKFELTKKKKDNSELLCATPENIIITKTAPSVERFRKYSSSSTDDVCDAQRRKSSSLHPDKYSLIDYRNLPSASLEAIQNERRDERLNSQNVYFAGKIVRSELAGAASDTDSEVSQGGMADHAADEDRVTKETERPKGRKAAIIERLESLYIEDPDRETGAAGELVEEVAEENKSLLWFLLKQVRPGMDLSKVVLPTFILEPRSFLDKLSDNYYHADMLTQAQTLEDPYLRFKCVLRWYLSGLYRKPKGLKKPYNPVLGESFRCRWKHKSTDNYTYYIAEQVSHHPPMSAFYVSNRKEGYIIEGSLLARSKFYGNSTSAILEGGARVHLLNWGETYFTTAPYAHCKGIVIGTLSMELGGKIQVICQETGYHADVEFKLRSFLGSSDQTNAISGRIKKGKDIIAAVEGYWDGRVEIKDKKTGEESTLLDVAVLKEQRLPRYLVKLEAQNDFESQKLWCKVSEAIAKDDQVAATEQKTIIEERQRELARSATNAWTPRFFHKDSSTMPPEGLIDHGWRYNYVNTEAWQSTEVYEYEEDFVIRSLSGPSISRISEVGSRHSKLNLKPCKLQIKLSDSESHDDVARRSKTSSRTLKQSLHAIDASLREQTIAIERLSKTVESLSEGQRTATQLQPRSMGIIPATTHGWDLFGGFVLAIVLQALLNWMFYNKD